VLATDSVQSIKCCAFLRRSIPPAEESQSRLKRPLALFEHRDSLRYGFSSDTGRPLGRVPALVQAAVVNVGPRQQSAVGTSAQDWVMICFSHNGYRFLGGTHHESKQGTLEKLRYAVFVIHYRSGESLSGTGNAKGPQFWTWDVVNGRPLCRRRGLGRLSRRPNRQPISLAAGNNAPVKQAWMNGNFMSRRRRPTRTY